MSGVSIVFAVLQLIAGLALTVVVLMQSGKSAGLSGAISGGAETFMSKGKAKTLDAKLAKATKWFAIAFVLLTLALNLFG
ncbi:MAG: preprotein translocase subunit SecG [Oscillospiraceae bacterium]|nr:preprotein translocase subunit SecG [Oscillospiraceae bacterium]